MTERPPEENWHDCACGERHWGTLGAAGLLAWRPDGCFLLHHRGEWTHHGGTWALPGGARRAGETFRTTALREAAEEVGLSEGDLVPRWWHIAPGHGRWTYTTVGAVTAPAAAPLAADWETAGVA
ncbi:MAG: NUDIX hydrolase, partial [Propionibacteriaceae bacterium]|nr:NUDIX hydrolase [Propionibacteriaceae bacterium]